LLVTTSQDGSVRLWDLETAQHVESFQHPGGVGEGDVDSSRGVLATRSGQHVFLWQLGVSASPAKVRAIVDALPFVLRDGTLVRKP
jgi:hypothetical protein